MEVPSKYIDGNRLVIAREFWAALIVYVFLYNRIRELLNKHIADEQFGFRKGRGCADAAYMGAGLLFFCLRLLTKTHRPDKRKIPVDTVL